MNDGILCFCIMSAVKCAAGTSNGKADKPPEAGIVPFANTPTPPRRKRLSPREHRRATRNSVFAKNTPTQGISVTIYNTALYRQQTTSAQHPATVPPAKHGFLQGKRYPSARQKGTSYNARNTFATAKNTPLKPRQAPSPFNTVKISHYKAPGFNI